MPLEPPDQQYLSAAEGFAALGMFEDANGELEKIDPFCRALPEVLAVRLAVYEGSKHWELAEVVAKKLFAQDPGNPHWAISLAYATRRLGSLERAQAILLEAMKRHPKEPIIPYNLACYACQTGELARARDYLSVAFTLQPECRVMALDDRDLQPLWAEL
jgi:tetratricopeptide (TPR) repeat protein